MKPIITILAIIGLFTCGSVFAETAPDRLSWSGKLQADGTPTPNIKLELGKKYKIKVSGTVNLGKWWQVGKPLMEDACFEFNGEIEPVKLDTFRNSMNISVCNDGKYHPDHIYTSDVFLAAQTGVHFWIDDKDYSDNTGSLDLEVIEVTVD